MLKASNDERGTVTGLAAISNDLDNTINDGKLAMASQFKLQVYWTH